MTIAETIANAIAHATATASALDRECAQDAYCNYRVYDAVVADVQEAQCLLDAALEQVDRLLRTCGLNPEVEDLGQGDLLQAKADLADAFRWWKRECEEWMEWAAGWDW